jgi:hypothetical protein
MKTIFLWMLKKYANTEKGRIEIMRILKSGIEKSFDEAIGYIENEK